MRSAAHEIKSCPLSYKVLPSLSRNLRPFGLQSSNWQPCSSQYYGRTTSVRFGSAEESSWVAVIWSLFLAWNLSLWQDHQKECKGLVLIPLAGVNSMSTSSLGCRSSHCLCWRQNPQVSLGCPVQACGVFILCLQTKPLLTPFARLLDRPKELIL